MESGNGLRFAGASGVVGAIVWIVNLGIEVRYNLDPSVPSHATGRLFVANQFGFFLAMTGLVVMLAGLARSGLVGHGLFGKISAWILFGGWAALWLALLASLAFLAMGKTAPDSLGILNAVGGIASMVGVWLCAGAVFVAKVWPGWQRYALSALGVYQIAFFYLTFAAGNGNPPSWAEGAWQAFYGLVGVALLSTRTWPEASPRLMAAPPPA
jgi:hypothetical protein